MMNDINNTIGSISEMGELADKLFSAIPGIKNATSVTTVNVEELSARVFKTKFVNRNTPCLIKGAVKHWPAVEKWKKKEYWINTCEDQPVTIFPNMNFFNLNKRTVDKEKMSFHDAIERLFQGSDHTFSIPAQFVGDSTLYAAAKKDIKGFPFLSSPAKPLWDRENSLFIYRRAATTWHVHYCDETLMCQVNGTKLVAIIPADIPKPADVIDFLEKESYLTGLTMDPDLKLNPIIVEVMEGDALYIPPGWFHCVVPKDAEVGFTLACNFRSPLRVNGNLSNHFTRKLYKNAWSTPYLKVKLMVPVYMFMAMTSYYLNKLVS